MDPALVLVLSNTGSVILSGLVTGYVLKRIEHNREVRDAGRLEVDRRRHLDRYEAVREIIGLGRSLYHHTLHPLGNVYVKEIREEAPRMRKLARANVGLVGEEYIALVMDFTDRAQWLADDAVKESGEKDPKVVRPSELSLLAKDVVDHTWDDLFRKSLELLK